MGLYNTNRFVLFLFVHFVMLAHGTLICAEIIRGKMLEIIEGNFVYVSTGVPITKFSIRVAFAAETTMCLILFVFALSTVVLGAFLVYHFRLIARNVTTNESFKWDTVMSLCREISAEHGGKSFRDVFCEEARKNEEFREEDLPVFGKDGLPCNIYDRGIVANVVEVFAPSLFVSRKCSSSSNTGRPSRSRAGKRKTQRN